MPFRPHWWVEKFLRKKNMDAGFEIFHIFYAKKRPFFPILDPPLIFGPKARIIFFGDFTKIFVEKKNNRFGPPPDPNLLISPNLKCDCSLRGRCPIRDPPLSDRALWGRCPILASKVPKMTPKWPPNGPRGPFRARQGPFGGHFGSVLERRCQQHS